MPSTVQELTAKAEQIHTRHQQLSARKTDLDAQHADLTARRAELLASGKKPADVDVLTTQLRALADERQATHEAVALLEQQRDALHEAVTAAHRTEELESSRLAFAHAAEEALAARTARNEAVRRFLVEEYQPLAAQAREAQAAGWAATERLNRAKAAIDGSPIPEGAAARSGWNVAAFENVRDAHLTQLLDEVVRELAQHAH